MIERIVNTFRSNSDKDKILHKAVKHIIGSSPSNLQVYRLAFMHVSVSRDNALGNKESNERLEYLGDAVLGMVVAEYLFKKFPYKNEGFLTDVRSRIVNRETLNGVARKLGFSNLIEHDRPSSIIARTSMYGDAFEAFLGAVYLDKGFAFTKNYILNRLLPGYYDVDAIVQNNGNYKSIVLEWTQREGRELRFEIEERGPSGHKEFIAQLFIDEKLFSTGNGFSKKKAEQSASEKACEALELK